MSTQFIMSDLLVELSTEQQQLLAGGQQSEDDSDETGSGTEESVSTDKGIGRPRRYRINSSSLVTVRRIS
ncbi:hypothetical protein WKK05_13770 [Nostoc sp. UHCC 0302]|uniref:hypothetical protein n=1 Tax=Nostoc sp. UHCC 0302 TaxID=3134896 RepID=UPI00311CD0AC